MTDIKSQVLSFEQKKWKAYYRENKEKKAAYYQANKDTIKARSMAWQKANPERRMEIRRVADAKYRAKKRLKKMTGGADHD